MGGLLSQIQDKFPEKLTHPEEQRLLRDCLFHGCKKSIWDSVKYCFVDPCIEYMHFLEECRKAEDEDKVGQTKPNPPKAKVAAATIPPTREDELAKQFRYQQHQIDILVGQVKSLVSAVKATRISSRGLQQVGQGCIPKLHGEEVQEAEVCLGRLTLEPLPSPGPGTPS